MCRAKKERATPRGTVLHLCVGAEGWEQSRGVKSGTALPLCARLEGNPSAGIKFNENPYVGMTFGAKSLGEDEI